jgi:NifU-like protein involved in Fe-S cluster formation
MDLHIRDGVVEDVRFTGGAVPSASIGSMLTEEMIGKRLDDLAKHPRQDILDNLGWRSATPHEVRYPVAGPAEAALAEAG